jgi:hypothetical protein
MSNVFPEADFCAAVSRMITSRFGALLDWTAHHGVK